MNCSNQDDPTIPTFLMHGWSGTWESLVQLQHSLEKSYPSRYFRSIEVLFNKFSSKYESTDRYIRAFAFKVKQLSNNSECVNLIGWSQGAFVSRAYVQLYSGDNGYPKVNKFIAIAGVMNGVYYNNSWPKVIKKQQISSSIIESNFGRNRIMIAAWWRRPECQISSNATMIDTENTSLNCNEDQMSTLRQLDQSFQYSLLYKLNNMNNNNKIKSLSNLNIMYMFYSTEDSIIIPPESSTFQFYKFNKSTKVCEIANVFNENDSINQMRKEGKLIEIKVDNYNHTNFVWGEMGDQFYKRYVEEIFR